MIFFQPNFSGVSGDMLIASLIGLGVDVGLLERFAGFNYGGVAACGVQIERDEFSVVHVEPLFDERTHHRHPHELYDLLQATAAHVKASSWATGGAMQAVRLLVSAECAAHKVPEEGVHLHEVGSFDTVFDCLGFYMLLDNLGDPDIYSAPILTGQGFVNTAHGKLPVPPPAVRAIAAAKSVPLIMGGPAGEAATPTGVALLASCSQFIDAFPPAVPLRSGYGRGNKIFEGCLNLLPAHLMESTEKSALLQIEATLDDITGEEIARALNALCVVAKEAVCLNGLGKKGRPVYILRALIMEGNFNRARDIIFSLSSTRGFRYWRVSRVTLNARTKIHRLQDKQNVNFPLRYKISRLASHVLIKPEFEDIEKINK